MRTLTKEEMKAVSGGISCNDWPYNSYNCSPVVWQPPKPNPVCVKWEPDPRNYGGAWICTQYK